MAGALTTHAIVQQKAASQGIIMPIQSAGYAGTSAAATSGYISASVCWNTIGTTLGTSYSGIHIPQGLSGNLRPIRMDLGMATPTTIFLCLIYKLGTITVSATGSEFTHNPNFTGPINRTNGRMGTSTAINMMPLIFTHAADTVAAAVYSLTYVNQLGNSITGVKTMIDPSITTAIGSGFIHRLEDGDSAIQDVTAANVGTASTTGTKFVLGLEPLAVGGTDVSGIPSTDDLLFSPPSMHDMLPGTPTTGSLTLDTDYWLCPVSFGNYNVVVSGQIYAVLDA